MPCHPWVHGWKSWDWCWDQLKFCSVLASGHITWIRQLGWISDGSNVGNLESCSYSPWRLLNSFLDETSVFKLNGFNLSVSMSTPSSSFLVTESRFTFWKFRLGVIQFIFFSKVLTPDSNGRRDINFFVLSFFGFKVKGNLRADLRLLLRLANVLLEFCLSSSGTRC